MKKNTGSLNKKKKLYNGIPNVTVWQVLRERKEDKLLIVQVVKGWIVCLPLR
jgi:hypothetical protein